MGRSKSRKLHNPSPRLQNKHKKQTVPKARPPKKPKAARVQPPPTVPFASTHRILLVGEGDFSFSRSLVEHRSCTSIYATSYDTRSAVLSKYPQAASHTKALEAEGCKIEYGVDATKLGRTGGNGGRKELRKGEWDRIVFNFPHVGGLTKDVNRQVRANQELLIGFFTSALPLLSSNGQLVVTIFEGEPYELWNIRDLVRHAGLRVERGFRFLAEAYPGYKHARTLGSIYGGGGWKGEDRPARTYILAEKNAQRAQAPKKQKRDGSDSEDD